MSNPQETEAGSGEGAVAVPGVPAADRPADGRPGAERVRLVPVPPCSGSNGGGLGVAPPGDIGQGWGTAPRVPVGPFDEAPADLMDIVTVRPDGTAIGGRDINKRTAAWLRQTLDEAGIELGDYDAEVVRVIAHEGWPLTQAVAGWILRARRTH
jgi:hypothetical protein